MAAVLDVPELFHLVLSFSPARDLFNVAAVSKGFRPAVWASHGAQKTLFLRTRPTLPGRWYLLQSRKHRRSWRNVTKFVFLIEPLPHKPNTIGSRYQYTYEDFSHLVELCPWLDGVLIPPPYKVYRITSILAEMLTKSPLDYARFPVEPEQGTFFSRMLLTSPPCHDAIIHLVYVNYRDNIVLSAGRDVHDDSALTVGSLLQAANRIRGDVYLTRTTTQDVQRLEDTCLADELTRYRPLDRRFWMDTRETIIRFKSKAIVTPKGWKALQTKLMLNDMRETQQMLNDIEQGVVLDFFDDDL